MNFRTTLASIFALALVAGCSAGETDASSEGAAITGGRKTLALAGDLPAHCSSAELRRIRRPLADGTDIAWGFRFKAPAPGSPVLVFLPGGPGQASTTTPPEIIPEGWGYLLTDPRGVGCNALDVVPSGDAAKAFFSTDTLASDVIAAIEDRKLDNYVLYGISYGTLLGTTVASRLEKTTELPRPKAVVLEGVLGRAFGDDFVGATYLTQWERVRSVLPADVLAKLDGDEKPYGLDAEQWSRALMGLLPVSTVFVANLLGGLSTTLEGTTKEGRAASLAQLESSGTTSPLPDPGARELYRQVACREIMDTVPENDLDVVFRKGKLVRNSEEEGTKCGGIRVSPPYDSAKLPFASKVFYFIGADDVATPAWQGAYHYEHHTGAATKIVTVGGGHNSLQFNQAACAPALLASIASGASDLDTALATCPEEVVVETK